MNGGPRVQGGQPFALSSEKRGRPYRGNRGRRYSEMPIRKEEQE
jgi:hypothetical protein